MIVMACCVVAAAAPVSLAGWSRQFALSATGSLDDLSPQIAYAASGVSATAYQVADVDTPGVSQAYVTIRSARGAVSQPIAIRGAEEILALAYDGPVLELLAGSSPSGLTCCSSAAVIPVTPNGRVGSARTLNGGLAGDTSGALVTLADGQMLASLATERGVWAYQSVRGAQFGAQHLLSGTRDMPATLSVAWLGAENTVVAWTAGTRFPQASGPRSIFVSGGTRQSAPHRALKVVTVASGHQVDELAIAPHGAALTAAWIESWTDSHGVYHSQVRAADVGAHPVARTLSPANRLASGLDFGADRAGDQAVTWASCALAAACTAQGALRGAGASFSAPRDLGPIDASQQPSVAVTGQGEVLAGWVSGGQPFAAVATRAGALFGAQATFDQPTALASATDASDLTVAAGPGRQALASWIAGGAVPSVGGAAFRGP